LENIQGIEKIKKEPPLTQLLYLQPNTNLEMISHEILMNILEQKCSLQSFRFLKPSLERVYLKYIEGDLA
jgi:hypothetical protein